MATNYVPHDPKLTVGGMQAVIWVETAVAIAFVSMRGLIKFTGKEKPNFDDAWVVFALLCMIISSALYTPVFRAMFLLSELELGHVPRPPPNFVQIEGYFLRDQFAIIILFWTTVWSVKASFLAFYKQIFTGQFVGWQRLAWYIVAGFLAATWIANFILQFFACAPFWTYFVIGQCNTPRDIAVSNDSLYFATASDIFTDLLVMALPLSILWNLHMNKRSKVALGVLFLTGFVIILFAILRLVYTVPEHAHVNPKWLAVWSSTESCIAVVVSSALPLRKYLVRRGRQQSAGASAGASANTASQSRSGNETMQASQEVSTTDGTPKESTEV